MLARSTSLVLSLALLVSACGPEVTRPVECESLGATQLLALGDGPIELLSLSDTVRAERGWIVVHEGRGLAIECGAAPREFARDIETDPHPIPGSGGAWLDESFLPDGETQWVVLDPWGGRDPFAIEGGPLGMGDAVVVSADMPTYGGAAPKLWKTTFDGDGEPTQVEVPYRLPNGDLGDFLYWSPRSWPESSRYAYAIVRRDDGTEPVGVAIDLETANVEIVGGPAGELSVRADERFIAIFLSKDEDPSYLIVRQTQRTLQLGYPGWWGPGSYDQDEPAIVIMRSPETSEAASHVVFLPGLEEAWLEGWFETEEGWVAEDGRRLLVSDDGLHVIAPGQTVATRLGDGRIGDACVVGNDVYVKSWDQDLRSWTRIVRMPLDGSAAETVIEGPVRDVLPLVDGRWAVMREDDDLRIHDPRTGEETVMAHGVELFLGDARSDDRRTGCTFWNSVTHPHEEFRYVARDDDGELALWSYRVVTR